MNNHVDFSGIDSKMAFGHNRACARYDNRNNRAEDSDQDTDFGHGNKGMVALFARTAKKWKDKFRETDEKDSLLRG